MNQGGSGLNVNYLTQSVTFQNSDVDPIDGQLHVRFALLPVVQNGGHPFIEQPYYFVAVTAADGSVLASDLKVAAQTGVPWQTDSTANVQYLDWQLYDYTSSGFNIGSTVTLTVLASGCDQGGHFGQVYVDAASTQVTTLAVGGTATTTVNQCDDITYHLTYQNQQGATANNVVIRFATPTNTVFKSATSTSSSCSGPTVGSSGTVSCTVASLATGESGTIDIVVTYNCAAPSSGVVSTANYGISATGASELLGPLLSTAVGCVPKTCQELGFT